MLVDMFCPSLLSNYVIVQDPWLVNFVLPPCSSRKFLVLQLFFLKKNYWQWAPTEENTILEITGGSSPVQTHVQSQSLDLLIIVQAPVMDMVGTNATMLLLVPAPVTDMGADAIMLRRVPAPVTRTGVDTVMDPNSEDERTAKVHEYQTPMVSAHGKELRYSNVGEDIGAIDDSRYNQRSNVNMMSLLYT